MSNNLSKGLLKRLCTQIGIVYTKELEQVVSAYHAAKCEESEAKLKLAREALQAECGNRCNAEYNPCAARQALDRMGE